MSEKPDQWYQDALEAKHEAQMRAIARFAAWQFWAPKLIGLAIVVALGVIAWKI